MQMVINLCGKDREIYNGGPDGGEDNVSKANNETPKISTNRRWSTTMRSGAL